MVFVSAFILTLCLLKLPGTPLPFQFVIPTGSLGMPNKLLSHFPFPLRSWYTLITQSPVGKVISVLITVSAGSHRIFLSGLRFLYVSSLKDLLHSILFTVLKPFIKVGINLKFDDATLF